MPLIEVHLIENVFNPDQKRQMIEKLTDAMVSIEGENMRGVTWVKISEVSSGEWGIGGQPLTTQAVKDLAAGGRQPDSLSRLAPPAGITCWRFVRCHGKILVIMNFSRKQHNEHQTVTSATVDLAAVRAASKAAWGSRLRHDRLWRLRIVGETLARPSNLRATSASPMRRRQ